MIKKDFSDEAKAVVREALRANGSDKQSRCTWTEG